MNPWWGIRDTVEKMQIFTHPGLTLHTCLASGTSCASGSHTIEMRVMLSVAANVTTKKVEVA